MANRLHRFIGIRMTETKPDPKNTEPPATTSAPRSDNSMRISSSSWSAVSIPSLPQAKSHVPRLPPVPATPTNQSSESPVPPLPHTDSAIPTQPSTLQGPRDTPGSSSPQTRPQPRRKRVAASGSLLSSHRNSLVNTQVSSSSQIGEGRAPPRQFTIPHPLSRSSARVQSVVEPVTSGSPAGGNFQVDRSPVILVRRPSPTPQSLSSASSRSSDSYVSLKSGGKPAHSDGEEERFSEKIVNSFLAPFSPRIPAQIKGIHPTLIEDMEESPLDGQPEYDGSTSLLLPEERERVLQWATQVEPSDLPEEDQIVADEEVPTRLPQQRNGDTGASTTPVNTLPSTDQSVVEARSRGQARLPQPPVQQPSDARWMVDGSSKKWIWCGMGEMPPLPQEAVLAGIRAEQLDFSFNRSVSGASPYPGRPPIIETPDTMSTIHARQDDRSPSRSRGLSPQPIPSSGRPSLLPPEMEMVPLVSPSPFSQLPSPMRPNAQILITSTPLPDQYPTPSTTSLSHRPSSRELSPETPGRLELASHRQQSTVRWGSSSTESGRGRSPTRRSWKATSERPKGSQPQVVAGQGINSVTPDPTGLTDMASLSRPRTSSRSPDVYIRHPPLTDLGATPSVTTSKLFYNHRFAAPALTDPANISQSIGPPPTIVSIPTQPSPAVQASTRPTRPLSHVAPALPAYFRRRSVPAVVAPPPDLASPVTIANLLSPAQISSPLARTNHDQRDDIPSRLSMYVFTSNNPSYQSYPQNEDPVTPAPPNTHLPGDAFLKLVSLITNATSALSSDKRGVPRWKSENLDLTERIKDAYEEFVEQVGRTRARFRPWMSAWSDMMADENALIEEVEGRDFRGGGKVMYLDHVLEALEGPPGMRRRVSVEEVQETIMQEVVREWHGLLSTCVTKVQYLLTVHVKSIIASECAGLATDEFLDILMSIVDAELQSLLEKTAMKLGDILALESSHMFSLAASRSNMALTLLTRYKSLRHRAHKSLASFNKPNHDPRKGESASHPAIRHEPSLSSATGTQTGTINISHSQSRSRRQSPVNASSTAIARLRRFSLLGGGSDSLEYTRDMRLALGSLTNMGFADMTPDKLYELLAEQDPTDEAIEVMTSVEAYFEAAWTRFTDYATLQIEHQLVNRLGPNVNTALLQTLNIAGDDIKERCVRWMI